MFLGLVLAPWSFRRAAPWIGGLLALAHAPLPGLLLRAAAGRPLGRGGRAAVAAEVVTFVAANLPLSGDLRDGDRVRSRCTRVSCCRGFRGVTVPTLRAGRLPCESRRALAWVLTHAARAPVRDDVLSHGSRLLALAERHPRESASCAAMVATDWMMTGIAFGRRALASAGTVGTAGSVPRRADRAPVSRHRLPYYRAMPLLLVLMTMGIGFVLRVPQASSGARRGVDRVRDRRRRLPIPSTSRSSARQALRRQRIRTGGSGDDGRRSAEYWRRDEGAGLRGAGLLAVVGQFGSRSDSVTYAATEHRIGLQLQRPQSDFCDERSGRDGARGRNGVRARSPSRCEAARATPSLREAGLAGRAPDEHGGDLRVGRHVRSDEPARVVGARAPRVAAARAVSIAAVRTPRRGPNDPTAPSTRPRPRGVRPGAARSARW